MPFATNLLLCYYKCLFLSHLFPRGHSRLLKNEADRFDYCSLLLDHWWSLTRSADLDGCNCVCHGLGVDSYPFRSFSKLENRLPQMVRVAINASNDYFAHVFVATGIWLQETFAVVAQCVFVALSSFFRQVCLEFKSSDLSLSIKILDTSVCFHTDF